MGEASIPVDLFNPGEVFACLGFLEAAEVLVGAAEGGFDWTSEANVRFRLCAGAYSNPFGVVLEYLAEAKMSRCAPMGYDDPPPKKNNRKAGTSVDGDGAAQELTIDGPLERLPTFPSAEIDLKTLPIRLEHDGRQLNITHWCDGSSRDDFKLYAGQQRAPAIARAMLQEVAGLWKDRGENLTIDPFNLLVPLGGSTFKFDARKAWTAIDAGYSPDTQGHSVSASPVVEMLAAVGLEHARPDEYETRQVRYGVWNGLAPAVLARPLLAGSRVGIPVRTFRFTLDLAGQNKVVTFAYEERL